ncbi:magnesium chelatase [Candidatus Wolfebacteria bacterium]|nr:MAG: magnesium chelatase [Candidatus Wolfebacteria bacterium]
MSNFSRVYSAQTNALKGQIIDVEVDVSKNTLHAFSIVGLPDKAVEEARDRVSSAIKNTGHKPPKQQYQKIIVSLSPAEIKKEGSYFDLSIALGYLLSEKYISFNPEEKLFIGELSLNGELRPIRGALPIAQEAKRNGFKELYLPKENAQEAALVDGITIYGVSTLKEIIDHLIENEGEDFSLEALPKTKIKYKDQKYTIDFSDIKGQASVKRGLEIAAAGGHNIAMSGPPGTGKTMLARVFSSILPKLSHDDILEITGIHSIAGAIKDGLVTDPPFRSPHHTSSYVSLIGGGTYPKPGEVTLAHRGVLFLDEFPEFERRAIESLRQPLEDNIVVISRAKGTAHFPSNFILIAAMNPCPCGNYRTNAKECICTPSDLARYQRKVSGPIMDRIDMWVQVENIDFDTLSSKSKSGDETKVIKKRVEDARDIQRKRFEKLERNIQKNSEMNVKDLQSTISLSDDVKTLLNESAKKLNLSPRGYHRVLKLAQTIADLDTSESIHDTHILEALQYRPR